MLSGPSVKITEVTAVTWLSVLSRLVRIFTAVGPACACVRVRARACMPACLHWCVCVGARRCCG